jgi:cytochrome c
MIRILTAVALTLSASAVYAEGDAAAGKKGFNKCKACHAVVSDAGDVIVKGGKTGPNLYGVVGRTAGTVDGYKYGKDLIAAGEAGLIWDEASFSEYVKDPKKFLQAHLDSRSAKSKMSFKLRKGAEDVYAYLDSISQ